MEFLNIVSERPNHALQRIPMRNRDRSCNRRATWNGKLSWPPSLSLGR